MCEEGASSRVQRDALSRCNARCRAGRAARGLATGTRSCGARAVGQPLLPPRQGRAPGRARPTLRGRSGSPLSGGRSSSAAAISSPPTGAARDGGTAPHRRGTRRAAADALTRRAARNGGRGRAGRCWRRGRRPEEDGGGRKGCLPGCLPRAALPAPPEPPRVVRRRRGSAPGVEGPGRGPGAGLWAPLGGAQRRGCGRGRPSLAGAPRARSGRERCGGGRAGAGRWLGRRCAAAAGARIPLGPSCRTAPPPPRPVPDGRERRAGCGARGCGSRGHGPERGRVAVAPRAAALSGRISVSRDCPGRAALPPSYINLPHKRCGSSGLGWEIGCRGCRIAVGFRRDCSRRCNRRDVRRLCVHGAAVGVGQAGILRFCSLVRTHRAVPI